MCLFFFTSLFWGEQLGNAAKKLVISGIIILITILLLSISIHFMFRGPAAPFFVIHNHDIISHEVTVEVFDHNSKQIINEIYNLEPHRDFTKRRPLSVRLNREKEYTFKVIMDKQITNISTMEIPGRKTSVNIRLYTKFGETVPYNPDREAIPILVEIVEWM
jgi:hypothetical protein